MLRPFVYHNGQSRALESDPYHFLEKLDSGENTFQSIHCVHTGVETVYTLEFASQQ